MPKTAWHSSKSLTYLNAIRQCHPCTVVGLERPGTTVSTVVLDLWGGAVFGESPSLCSSLHTYDVWDT